MTSLIESARAARVNAYAPYSGYTVGAAVEDCDGGLYGGCNIENRIYSATVCAERAAIIHMVLNGGKRIRRIAVATRDGGTPCGVCLQTILEFAADPQELEVIVLAENSEPRVYTLAQLMPFGSSSDEVHRTE